MLLKHQWHFLTDVYQIDTLFVNTLTTQWIPKVKRRITTHYGWICCVTNANSKKLVQWLTSFEYCWIIHLPVCTVLFTTFMVSIKIRKITIVCIAHLNSFLSYKMLYWEQFRGSKIFYSKYSRHCHLFHSFNESFISTDGMTALQYPLHTSQSFPVCVLCKNFGFASICTGHGP